MKKFLILGAVVAGLSLTSLTGAANAACGTSYGGFGGYGAYPGYGGYGSMGRYGGYGYGRNCWGGYCQNVRPIHRCPPSPCGHGCGYRSGYGSGYGMFNSYSPYRGGFGGSW